MQSENQSRNAFLPAVDVGETLRGVLQTLRRRWILILGFAGLSVALAIFYVINAEPEYTANGAILIDPRVGGNPDATSPVAPSIVTSDALTVDSQLRVLTSREVTGKAARELGFGQGEAASSDGPSLPRRVLDALGIGSGGAEVGHGLTEEMRAERNFEALRRDFTRGLSVERAGESFVIDISYTSPDLPFAARAVNALMQQYLQTSGQQQIENVERTQVWLSSRIESLGEEVREAERTVAEYRRENALMVPEGELLPSEIALNAANQELVRLQGEALAAEVEIEQLTQQIEAGDIGSVQLPAQERTDALSDFEQRYTELLQEERDLLVNWDESARIVQGVRQRQDQTRELILNEYRQIRDRLQAQLNRMESRVAATESLIAELREDYGADAGKTVELRSLEREAEAKRELYERLLEQYNSATQLVTFETTSARVIAWAVPPDTKSAPQSRQLVILAAFAGIVIGTSLAFLLESLDNRFRAHSDAGRELGLRYLGVVPEFRSDRRATRKHGGRPLRRPRSLKWNALPPAARLFDFAVEWPASVTAATLRSIHVRLAVHQNERSASDGGQVIGFSSSTKDEGKTTLAMNFASFLASRDETVAIVDLDMPTRQLSRLVETVLPETNTLAALKHDPEAGVAGLSVVPEFPGLAIVGNDATDADRAYTPRDLDELRGIIESLRQCFDYVIVDLPPAQGVADTEMLAGLCDGLIFVIKWGATPHEQAVLALRQQGLSRDRIFGAVYSRANLKDYRLYNRHQFTDHYG